ncbi:MAG TPA: outer membrane beta-barrel protein [Sphingobacteriaceae bacterium]
MSLRRVYKTSIMLGLLLSCATLYSQPKKTTFGFKGGINQSEINAKELDGTKSGYSGTELYGGFFADTRISNNFKLGNELLFSFTDDYHFIEIPLHLKYNLIEKWNVLLGPKLDYIVDRNDDWNNFKKLGLSGEIGSQYRINRLFFAEVKYARSFTRQINSDFFDFYNGKRNTFRVGLGVNFSKSHSPAENPGPMRLRVGASAGIPLTNGYDGVYGADLRLQKSLSANLSGLLSAGYNHYSLENKKGFEETNIAYFPVKLGLKVFPGKGFYLSPEMGVAIGTKSEAYTYPLIYAAGMGMETKKGIDLSLRYEKMTGNIHDYLNEIKRPGQLALRMEYGFNLNPAKSKSPPKDLTPAALTGKHRKTVYAEGLGNGIGVSGNFDIRLKPDRNDGFGISAGAGIAGTYLTVPLAFNYIIGKRRSGFETGIGITPIFNLRPKIRGVQFGDRDYTSNLGAAASLNAGYRLQSKNGFMLRANASAIYLDRLILPIPGLAIGYNFK